MAFPRRLLHPDEEVAVDVHPHWWYYAKSAAVLVLSIVLGIVTLWVDDGTGRTALTWASLALIIGSVCWLIVRYLKWAATSFVVTDQRVIFRSGVLAKSGVEVRLEHVFAVHSTQTIFGRLVGAGDVVLEAGDGSGQQRFTDIGRPRQVERAIHVQREERLADRLERFEAMFERGTITLDEFRAQKDRLLGR